MVVLNMDSSMVIILAQVVKMHIKHTGGGLEIQLMALERLLMVHGMVLFQSVIAPYLINYSTAISCGTTQLHQTCIHMNHSLESLSQPQIVHLHYQH
jgi:hypothetical protein